MQMLNEKNFDDPYRIQHRFWLDGNRHDERDLVEYIADLKKKRSFVSTIRDALRLIQDLRQGSIAVLLSLFPWVWDQIEAEVRASLPQSPRSDVHTALQEHMERMEKLLAERVSKNSLPQIPSSAPRALNPRNTGDIDIEVKTAPSNPEAGKRATQNFMSSLMALQTGYRSPEPHKLNRMSKSEGPQKADSKKVTTDIQTSTGNAKPMKVPALDTPVFEDDADDLIALDVRGTNDS